ncbi:MAG: LPS export ABC transporter permease LptF [Alphaproteobacteria bacterium]|nr:MAG: LPS export ABC transporter permease LptF [Alphaproteobacteria bacterium]
MRLPLLDRYLLRKLMVPLLATVAIAAALLLMERMIRLFDFVVNQNGPVSVVWRMLAHLVPHYMGMALPVGLMLGILLVMRQLSLSSELDAMQAGGISLTRILRPFLIVAVLLGMIDIWIVGWREPLSRYAYRHLEFELRSGALGASVRVGEFVDLGDGILLRVGAAENGGRQLRDLFVRRRLDSGRELAITAHEGSFVATEEEQKVFLRLKNGMMLDSDPRHMRPRVMEFALQDIVVALPEITPFRRRSGQERETTLDEQWHALSDPQVPDDLKRRYLGKLHWRILHFFTMLAIPFLAVPLGIVRKRSSGGSGLVLGVGGLIVYNEFLEAGDRAVAAGASPWIAEWGQFAIFALIGGYLFWTVAFHPGRGLLGRIDRLGEALSRPLRRFIDRLLPGDSDNQESAP